jgi:CheY-like chemotaxis protein
MSTLLLVEDEPLIRMLLAEMVKELGHTVVAEAGTSEQALRLARSADFGVAILDINLGGQTVEPIADVLDRRGLPIVFASGYDQSSVPAAFVGRTLVQKPFEVSQLAAAIATATGHAPQCSEASSDLPPASSFR